MPGIIVGIDGSDRSRQALEWAINEAAVRHAPLTVLTVSEAPAGGYWGDPVLPADLDRTEQAQEAARVETDNVLAKVGEGGKPGFSHCARRYRHPRRGVLHASAGADMVVVGSRSAGGFKRLLLGSVSSHIAHHAHCPVVVIPTDNA